MISDLLKIEKGVTSVIGGGGKTSLIHTLAKELVLKGTVIITTTTHIYKSTVFHNVVDDTIGLSQLRKLLIEHKCICLGSESDNGKLRTTYHTFDDLLSIADYVLVEADGSKGLPLKAHLDFEPVLPVESNEIILVVGVDAVGEKLEDVTHRSEKASQLLNVSLSDVVTPQLLADLLNIENLHDKVVINKCDDMDKKNTAELISGYINTECVITSLLKGEWYAGSN